MAPVLGRVSKKWILVCAWLLLMIYAYRKPLDSSEFDFRTTARPSHKPLSHARLRSEGTAPAIFNSTSTGADSRQLFNTFTHRGRKSIIYSPYPAYNTAAWSRKWAGRHMPCTGPRGVFVNNDPEDMLMAHLTLPEERSTTPTFGSYEETGLDDGVCFGSAGRYRPYGYSEDPEDGVAVQTSSFSGVVWDYVDWGYLQNKCVRKNQNRWENLEAVERGTVLRYPTEADVRDIDTTLYFPRDKSPEKKKKTKAGPKYMKRTAVIFQVTETMEWMLDTTQYMRSLIVELSLHTGGEYEVLILVEAENDNEPIFDSPGVYQSVLKHRIPKEFQGMSVLYNRKALRDWYPKTQQQENKDEGQPTDTHQALQLLSLARPDIEFFWHMDLDARYTGHHYGHLEAIASWSRAKPRDLSWEQASQVYMEEVHGTWKNFTSRIERQADKDKVRGALRTQGIEPVGPDPPSMLGWSQWGINEEADLITLGPIFDHVHSDFESKGKISNYPDGAHGTPQRATSFPTMSRISKRLIRAMHHGQVTMGTHMPPTMFPASTALHHGLKVVAFPLPIFLDHTVSAQRIESKFNDDWGSQTYDQPYKYKDIWRRMTFAIRVDEKATYGDEMYKRWLGYDKEHTKGLCLPGMMLHPIRGV